MPLIPGTRIGVYEVLSPLGAGGMGEVYRARDTRLNRDVALKVLPDAFSSDPDRLARFEREAQVLALLNHPHIAAIHGLEESSPSTLREPQGRPEDTRGTTGSGQVARALVLELVEGDTLADRLVHGAIPVQEALAIARQIADALDAAHEHGIIHRDLKPANVKITPSGTVKVLDFGLAKLAESPGAPSQQSASHLTMSPTLASPMVTSPAMTTIGVILGTAAYMSPEQAKGRQADKRSDVWAFGCVLFEMLTGQRPFEGADLSDLIASVLKSDPPLAALPSSTPPAVRAVIERCMRKDPKQRLRDMGDVRLVLDGAFDGPAAARASEHEAVPSRVRRALPWVAGTAIGGALAALAAWSISRTSTTPPVEATRFALTLPETDRLTAARGTLVTLSPDGRTLVYRAQRDGVFRLYRRPLDRFEATPIGDPDPDEAVGFSPDGQWLLYFSGVNLKKVPIAGGPSQTLGQAGSSPRGIDWGADNTIVIGMNRAGIGSIPVAGGALTIIVKPDNERQFWYPQVLPGGAILYTASDPRPDGGEIQVFVPRTGERRTLLAGSAGHVLSSGHLVYLRSGSVWAVGFDLDRLEVRGTPVPLVEGVRVEPGGAVQFAASAAGTLAYLPGGSESGLRLAWLTRDGKEEPLETPQRLYTFPRLSPDGTRVAVYARDQENDIWVWSFDRKTLTRLTFDPATDSEPAWSSDGTRLFFVSAREKTIAPYWQPANGTGKAERIATHPYQLDEPSVSPDGKWIAMRTRMPDTGDDIVGVDLTQNGRVVPLAHTKFTERNPSISMDGRWIAYESDESGENQIYVRPFPDVDTGRWQVSQVGGTRPLWVRNGHELFYQTRDQRLMSVPFTSSPSFEFGNPTLVADLSGYAVATGRNYDVSADGRRILVVATADRAARPDINVVLNWAEELKKKIPIQ